MAESSPRAGESGAGIVNSLTSAASTLWQQFAGGWGTRSVGIVNTLVNSAASLWQQFRSGWAGRTLGLTVTYSTNVSVIKRAVYKALGSAAGPPSPLPPGAACSAAQP